MVSGQSGAAAPQTLPPCMIGEVREFVQGMKVYWNFKSLGGRAVQNIPAIVKKVMPTRIRIEFMAWEAGGWVACTRTIATANVTPRDDQVARIDHADTCEQPIPAY